jgi:Ca2+-binding RTX toxin-like protein
VIVDIVDGALSDGDTSSVVTFTFSEAPGASFTEADIQVSAGLTLNAGSLSPIDATHYQATVTAVDGFTGTGTVSLAAGSWTDAALNLGGAGSDTVSIDTANASVIVDIVDGALSDGDSSSVVTFTFSEAPGASFTEADIQVSAGLTLNAGSLSMIDATHYQATVTAVDSFTGTGTVSLAAGSWTDATGNLGESGSDTVAIDTQPLADPNDFDDQATGEGLVGNIFFGSSGSDNIPAINQAQVVYGGAGNDIINGGNSGTGETIYGGSGNDTINGSNGADTLYGGSGNDIINGGDGKDIIIGGYGADTLTGGLANDTFKFLSEIDSRGTQYDTIQNFDSGNDTIDLTAIDGATAVQGLVGSAGIVAAHSISWFVDNATNQTIVYVNTTGTANQVDMEIHLAGTNINLSGSDILHHT